jgi:mannose-6-phosphate isomerase-like protein (cupin superfamily)
VESDTALGAVTLPLRMDAGVMPCDDGSSTRRTWQWHGAASMTGLDQFFRVEEGQGKTVLDGVKTAIKSGYAVVVPAGTRHNIINTGTEHFDGKTSDQL